MTPLSWEDPPTSKASGHKYDEMVAKAHERPGDALRVFHGRLDTRSEKSNERVKVVQALKKRCDRCKVQSMTMPDGMFSIWIRHERGDEGD